MATLEFHTNPTTVGEVVMIQRLQRNAMDVEAMASLLASRTSQPVEAVYALPFSDLIDALPKLAEALKVSQTLTVMMMHWDDVLGGSQ